MADPEVFVCVSESPTARIEIHQSHDADPRRYQHAAALAAVLVVAGSAVATGQLTKSVQEGFTAPFFIMCLHLSFLTPLGLVASLMPVARRDPPQERHIGFVVVVMLVFLQVTASYLYVSALSLAPAGIVQVLFGTSPAFVAVVSRVLLREMCTVHIIVAVLLAVAGGISLGWGSAGRSSSHTLAGVLWGAILAIIAVFAQAIYKVVFKLHLGSPSLRSVLLLLGVMGMTATALGMPLSVLIAMLGVEDEWWSSSGANVRWGLVFAGAACDALYYMATAFALALSSPIFVAVGILLAGPLSMTFDACVRGISASHLQIFGTICIMVSFVILALCPSISLVSSREPGPDPE